MFTSLPSVPGIIDFSFQSEGYINAQTDVERERSRPVELALPSTSNPNSNPTLIRVSNRQIHPITSSILPYPFAISCSSAIASALSWPYFCCFLGLPVDFGVDFSFGDGFFGGSLVLARCWLGVGSAFLRFEVLMWRGDGRYRLVIGSEVERYCYCWGFFFCR